MSVEQRIMLCRLLEKMDDQWEYGKKIGLENVSRFHGKKLEHRNRIKEEK